MLDATAFAMQKASSLARRLPAMVGFALRTPRLPLVVQGKTPVGRWQRIRGEQNLPRLVGFIQ